MTTDAVVLEPPAPLVDEYASWSWEAVSVHPGNSVMHRLANDSGDTLFLKIARHGWTPTAEAEAERTAWAAAFLPVPRVLRRGRTHHASWLLTEGIAGLDATAAVFRADVAGLVARLAHGLRRFHETPPDACPFQFRIADAARHVRQRLAAGLIDASRDFHREFAMLTPEAAVDQLIRTAPGSEDLVVCHGDYCVPNVLLRDNVVSGYVDLGELGIADRWWDLAVATWSVTWTFGPGYESLFLDAYGIRADESRIDFYRLLYDLAS